MILDKNEVMLINRLLLDYKNELLLKIMYYEKCNEQTKQFTSKQNYELFKLNWKSYENRLNEVYDTLTKLYEYYDDFNNLD